MRNPISGEIKELSETEFLALFDESVHSMIKHMAHSKVGIDAVICMENLQLDSSENGKRSAIIVGPRCQWPIEKVEEAGFRLGDVPSRFQYPTAIWRIEKEGEK